MATIGKSTSRTRATPKAAKTSVVGGSVLGRTKKHSLTRFAKSALKEYGSEVVEQRAIPDSRDGLKPVHRMLLWAAYKLGIHSNRGFKKSARIIGDVIGKYHPHGDISAYGALVGMTGTKHQGKEDGWYTRNCSTPLIEGQGNWGDFIDAAAAMRYTECRLSRYSDLYMLDPDYIAVMDFVPNYDDSEMVPVILPAKLPTILLNGYSSIAVGVVASSPPFGFQGVRDLTVLALQGVDITPKLCLKYLKPDFPFGGECISERKAIYHVLKYGKGSLHYAPTYEVNEKARSITFTSACPGIMSPNSVETFLTKLANLKEVGSVSDETDKRGPRYEAVAKRGLSHAGYDAMKNNALELSVRADSYDVNMTVRQPDGSALFKASNIVEIVQMWTTWRIEVELKVIARLISIQQQKLDKLTTIRTAISHLDIVFQALKLKKGTVARTMDGVQVEVDAAADHLMKHLKMRLDQANMILDMKVRQLRALELAKINEQIAAEQAELTQLEKDQKKPAGRALRDLEKLAKVVL